MANCEAAVLPLPAASCATLAATFTVVTVPAVVGVTLKVYVVPEPAKPDKVPLLTTMLPALKPVTPFEKVTVKGIGVVEVVLPEAPAVELMATVGATVSMVKVFVLLLALTAEPLLWAVARTVWLP